MRTNAAIRRATGFRPCVFRPPYGSSGADLVARTRELGMTSVLWSADPADWRTPGAGVITSRVLAQAGPGAIVLSHDGGGPRSQTLAALPGIVAGLRARGYGFTTVSGLLGYRERVVLER
jgi:peptidoglycan/xylan/chitin deacetylase (PgdA/CDA1 family)